MINDLFSSILNSSVKMYSIGAKIIKPHNEKPDELENTISQVCACLIILFYVYLCHRFVYEVDKEVMVYELRNICLFQIIALFRN